MEDGEEGGPGDPPVRVNMSTLKAWVGGRVRRINIPSKYQVTRAGLYTFALLNSAQLGNFSMDFCNVIMLVV